MVKNLYIWTCLAAKERSFPLNNLSVEGKIWGDVAFFLSLKEHQGTLCRSKLLAQRTGRGLLWTVLLMKCESNFHLVGKGPAGLRGQKILQNFAFHGC